MKFHLEADAAVQPTLAEMTKKAVEVLRKEKNGFFLFVDGGLIDAAHHKVQARMALDETVELSKAVQLVVDMTNEDDTLIVVTSDHSHVMTMSGYPERGRDVLGTTGLLALDNLPYTTLSYSNGPSVKRPPEENCNRHDLSQDDMSKYIVLCGI